MPEHTREEALEFARANETTVMATVEDGKPFLRVMQCADLDDDLTIWYATSAASNKVRHINSNPHVCIFFHGETGYLRVFGRAEIIKDGAKMDELWDDQWLMYWPSGKDDPDYRLIKITPEFADFLKMPSGDTIAQPVILD